MADQETVTLDDVAEFARRQRQHHSRGGATGRVGGLAHSVAGLSQQRGAVHRDVRGTLTKLLAWLAATGDSAT